jgi:hypothetical protein
MHRTGFIKTFPGRCDAAVGTVPEKSYGHNPPMIQSLTKVPIMASTAEGRSQQYARGSGLTFDINEYCFDVKCKA